MREEEYWFDFARTAQKRTEASDRDVMSSIGAEPQKENSIPLTSWWTRLDLILVVHLLRGVIENIQMVVILLRILTALLLIIAVIAGFALYHWLTF